MSAYAQIPFLFVTEPVPFSSGQNTSNAMQNLRNSMWAGTTCISLGRHLGKDYMPIQPIIMDII